MWKFSSDSHSPFILFPRQEWKRRKRKGKKCKKGKGLRQPTRKLTGRDYISNNSAFHFHFFLSTTPITSYHGTSSSTSSHIFLSSLRLSLPCCRNLAPNKKKISESPTGTACTSDHRSSPPPQTTHPSVSIQPFTKVRTGILPPIRIPARHHRFLSGSRPRMLHQERHRFGQPPPVNARKVRRFQLHHHVHIPIRRTLAEPPPPWCPGNILHESTQYVSRHPQG